ncbi:MAG: hypothetical protein KME14_10855 [Tildeniella torsiva UHER 1998/13D]|jgi:hypothetical protein|nr:hypothetical protein [Tildeniella torsiva UHER 1998/13D]
MTDFILSRDEVILRQIGDLDPATTINDSDELAISQGGAVRKTNLGDIFASVAEEAVEDVEELRTEILTALGDYVNTGTDQSVAGVKTFTDGPRITKAAGTAAGLSLASGTSERWAIEKNNVAESGSNAGSNLVISRLNDDGVTKAAVITVTRSTGAVALANTLSVAQAVTLSTTLAVTGNATVGGTLGVTGATTLTGAATLSNNLSVAGTSTLTGAASLGSTLAVTGVSTFTGQVNSGRVNAVFTGATSGQHSISAICQATTGDNISGINISSSNTEFSSAQITGVEEAHGTLKISHVKPTDSDANASGLSIDLKGTGTAAKGIFIDATEGGTTGNLLDIRNDGTAELRLTAAGELILAEDFSAPDAKLSIRLNDDADSGLSVKANSTSGGNLFELRRSSDSAVRTRFDSQCQFITQQNAYFTGPGLQIGSTSTTFGGGSGGIIGINNATTVPTTNPTSAVILYAQSGEFKTRSSAGVVATMGDALKIQGAAVQSATPTDGQTLVYVSANSRYEPQSVTGLTTSAQSIDGVKTFTSSPVVPDVAVGTKDDKVANTQFVQESLEASGWRKVQTNVIGASDALVDLVCSNYTSSDVDEVRFRITNLSAPNTTDSYCALIRINDLTNNQTGQWASAATFHNFASASVSYASFSGAWDGGGFLYAGNKNSLSTVEGKITAAGSGAMFVTTSEERLILGANFQGVRWSQWSNTDIYTNNKIQQVRAFGFGANSGGTALTSAVNLLNGTKIEWFIKVA